MNQHAKRNAGYTLVAALVLCIYGWYSAPIYTVGENFLNLTVDLFCWTIRCSGIALLIVAAIRFAGLRFGLLLDAIVSVICGLVMLFCAGYWCTIEGLVGTNVLFLVFGGVFCHAAFLSFTEWRDSAPDDRGEEWPPSTEDYPTAKPAAEPPQASAPAPEPDPVHPASVHPESLPEEGEPAPPEGYLAKLAEEEGQPPTASHE